MSHRRRAGGRHPDVRAIPVPPDGVAARGDAADFADAFAVRLARPVADLRGLVADVLGAPPLWFRLLIGLRDRIVAPFGVETSAALRNARATGDRIDFFPVLHGDADEIVLGARDRHLDFTIAFRIVRTRRGDLLVATTRVWLRNGFGRLYIAAIAPFHRMVVRSTLRRMAVENEDAIRP